MVLSNFEAINLTQISIQVQNDRIVSDEISLAERGVRNAAGKQQFKLLYNAQKIGNPVSDPNVDESLDDNQRAFRDVFIQAGYQIFRDEDTGFWLISWELNGAERIVNVYHVYTSLSPGSRETQTINAITNALNNSVPTVRANVILVNPPMSGGDVDETIFGSTSSLYYTYVVITQQPLRDTDYSSTIENSLTSAGVGYLTSPRNFIVYKIV